MKYSVVNIFIKKHIKVSEVLSHARVRKNELTSLPCAAEGALASCAEDDAEADAEVEAAEEDAGEDPNTDDDNDALAFTARACGPYDFTHSMMQ